MRIKLDNLDYSLELWSPSGPHKTFRLMKIEKGTRKSETINTPEIEQINNLHVRGALKEEDARRQLEIIRDRILLEAGVRTVVRMHSAQNRKNMERYLEFKYGPKMHQLKDPESTRNEWIRAMDAVGELDLRWATKGELEKQLVVFEPKKRARIIYKINTMLKFLRRDFTLAAPTAPKEPLRYIAAPDLPKLLSELPKGLRELHAVAFYTGVTLGEAFAINERSFRHGTYIIDIEAQIDREGNKRSSRLKKRSALYLPEGEQALLDWFRARKLCKDTNRINLSRITKQAASKAFPEQDYKQITFQDLRHSYAINMLRAPTPTPLWVVAECLGISYPSAKKLYGEFAPADDDLKRTLAFELKKKAGG